LVLHVTAAGIGLTMLLPFLWMVLTSLKTLPEVASPGWAPLVPQWGNYAEVFQKIPFARFFANSLLVAGWTTLLQVFTSAMAAYSFSRLQWPGRDKMFMAYLATTMLPGLVMMVPNYQMMIRLGLMDSLAGLVLPASFSAFGTFLLRQFMLSIPSSLDEAAEIDGASKWQVFLDVILPLARPGLITITIFTFLGSYNSFFWPLVLLRSVDNYTLPVGMLFFDSVSGATTHLLMAAVTMAVLPMVVIFVFCQRYLVEGIATGGVKG
jgi:ABC-type glycerol-3-phosphate transport system permease component